MRCFVHQDAEAVAVCRACFKGVCAACATLSSGAVACSPGCAETVEHLQRVVTMAGPNTRATQRTQATILLVMAIGTGIAAAIATDVGRGVLATVAVLLLLGAARYYRLARDWSPSKK